MGTGSSIFSMLFFLAFGTHLLMGLFMIRLNHNSSLHRRFIAICISLCFWSLGFAMASSAPDLETALFWRRFSAIGWSTVYSLLLVFVLQLTSAELPFKLRYVNVSLYLPALVCLYVFGLSSSIAPGQYNLQLTDFGWVNVAVNNGWDWFFYFYYLVYASVGIGVMLLWQHRAIDPKNKIQGRLIAASLFAMFLLGTFFDVLVPTLFGGPLPQISPLLALIPLGTFYYAIKRYHLMVDTSARKGSLILDETSRSRMYYFLGVAFVIVGGATALPACLSYLLGTETVLIEKLRMGIVSALTGFLILGSKGIRRERLRDTMVLVLTILSIVVFNIGFLGSGDRTLWAFSMVLLIVALVLDTKLPVQLISGTAIVTQIVLWFFVSIRGVPGDGSDYFLRVGILVVAYWIANFVNSIYVQKLRDNVENAELQALISATAFDFLPAQQNDFDASVTRLLDRVGTFFQAERGVLFEVDEGAGVMRVANEWCAPGVPPRYDSTYSIENGLFSSMFQDDKLMYSDAVDFLPLAATHEGLADLESLESVVALPIEEEDGVFGVLAFQFQSGPRQLSKASLDALKVIGTLVSDGVIRRRSEQEIRFLAYFDELTKLPNRTLFEDRLSQAVQLALRNEVFIGVIFVDLDGFKMINDVMGHTLGDQILKAVAQGIKGRLRKMDTVARFGGDEFVVMAGNIADHHDIHGIVEKIMELFQEPFVIDEHEFFVTASVGVALFPMDGENPEALIKSAGLAMQRAKANGKHQYALCTVDMKEEVKRNMKISNSLFRALAREELTLHYQPQVRMDTGEIVGFEALLRWDHPELGTVPPGVFIPIAEKNGLINSIGEWVLKTAARQNKAWQDAGYKPLPVFVNLSVVQLSDPRLVDRVRNVFQETGLSPEYLGLEITETIAITDVRYTLETFNRLKALGVSIVIDDFGTEYSSLSRLKALPIDGIKIDMHFVQALQQSKKDQAIAEVIINLAKNLGLGVLAEGVETEAQAEFLRLKLCDCAQGHYYFRPMSPEELESLVEANKLSWLVGEA